MVVLGAILSYPKLEGLSYKDILEVLRFHKAEIGDEVLDKIEARTPKDTGALREDEAWNGKTGLQGGILKWFVGSEWQLTEWGREYSIYQEGPPLGRQGWTSTGAPWQMFQKVTTEDLSDIEEWATGVVQEATDNVFQPLPSGGTP